MELVGAGLCITSDKRCEYHISVLSDESGRYTGGGLGEDVAGVGAVNEARVDEEERAHNEAPRAQLRGHPAAYMRYAGQVEPGAYQVDDRPHYVEQVHRAVELAVRCVPHLEQVVRRGAEVDAAAKKVEVAAAEVVLLKLRKEQHGAQYEKDASKDVRTAHPWLEPHWDQMRRVRGRTKQRLGTTIHAESCCPARRALVPIRSQR